MAEIKQLYGTLTTFLVTALESLAAASFWNSDSVDNEADLFADALVSLTLQNHASTAPTGEQAVRVYAYAALDDGEAFTDGVDGTEGAHTVGHKAHLRELGVAYFSAANQTRRIGPFSVAAVFGGRLPSEWGIVVENATGAALRTGNLAKYRGVKYQTV